MNTCSRHCIPLELDKKVVTGSQVCDLCKFASNKISRFNRGSRRRVNVSSSDVDLKREGNVLQLTKDNSRGLDLIHTQNALVYLYNSTPAGGKEAASQVLERASQTLNFTGHTVSDIMDLCAQQKARDVGQHRAHAESQSTHLTNDELIKIYRQAKRLTANVVFGSGNGQLGKVLFDEVRRRTLSKMQKDTKRLERTKKRLRALVKRAAEIRKEEKNYKKWKCAELKDI